jgi:hypothetical protein
MVSLVSSEDDVARHDKEEVRVVGRYEQVDVRMMALPPPRYAGHVAIVLDDDTRVLLYPVWDQQARRAQDEIARFAGKRVEATGTLHATAPQGEELVANLELPCLTDVRSIRNAP